MRRQGLDGPPVKGTVVGGDLSGTLPNPQVVDDSHFHNHDTTVTGVSADDHHNQSHVLATGAALGPDHTTSGLTIGWVLRATAATAAKFMQLLHSDLGGIGADDHHATNHVIADGTALGATHTTSGLTLGWVLKATAATTAKFMQLLHSELGGITATDHHAAPVAGPDADITIDAAGAAGTASTFARSLHGHKLATSASVPAALNKTPTAGTSTHAPSRDDHAHGALGNQVQVVRDTSAGSVGAGASVDLTINWPVTFGDANYTALATCRLNAALLSATTMVKTKSATQLVLRVTNNAGSAQTIIVDILGIHD